MSVRDGVKYTQGENANVCWSCCEIHTKSKMLMSVGVDVKYTQGVKC